MKEKICFVFNILLELFAYILFFVIGVICIATIYILPKLGFVSFIAAIVMVIIENRDKIFKNIFKKEGDI